jgi:hypothetical protein
MFEQLLINLACQEWRVMKRLDGFLISVLDLAGHLHLVGGLQQPDPIRLSHQLKLARKERGGVLLIKSTSASKGVTNFSDSHLRSLFLNQT